MLIRLNWLVSLSNYVDSLLACVIGHIFACVCEVQLRLCVENCPVVRKFFNKSDF